MKLLRDASENDIQELKLRLIKRKEQRLLDRDLCEVVSIVNRRSMRKGENKCQVTMM